jgi:hypothetical protein
MNHDDGYFVLWEIILTNPTECVRNHQSKLVVLSTLSPLLWVGGDLKFEVKKQSRRDNHKDQVEREREREREKEREPDRK